MMGLRDLRNRGIFIALTLTFVLGMTFAFSSVKAAIGKEYYVAPNGNDGNPGTENQPWNTIQKALDTAIAGDTIYIREGEYFPGFGGWVFQHSGTATQPITLTNYPGEQVVIRIFETDWDNMAFRCETTLWVTPKADYIRLIGSAVAPRTLSNDVVSTKGIVIQGPSLELDSTHTEAPGVKVAGCDYWEVAGIDFIDIGYGIFQQRRIDQPIEHEAQSSDYWYVHDNRVYGFYAESGMQFNGDNNTIESNEFYKVHDQSFTPWGCHHLNILGHHNVVRGNLIDKAGSSEWCSGILLEWDISDFGIYEQNTIVNLDIPIYIFGGDNNIIRNNVVFTDNSPQWSGGIRISSGGESHCNTEPSVIRPPEDPVHPDYKYFYEPRNCESWGNQIYNNTIDGYVESIRFYPEVPQGTIIRNNVFSGWERGSICHYEAKMGTCYPLPADMVADHNADRGDFGFVDAANHDFHLKPDSPLIDAGYDLGSHVTDDFDGEPRPQGGGYDIGAFEYLVDGPTPTPVPSEIPFFIDVSNEHWAFEDIKTLFDNGYVEGCSLEPLAFCPEKGMTRDEASVLVVRGTEGADYYPPDPDEQVFADVFLNIWHARWITKLAEGGYTDGCGVNGGGDPIFCPYRSHTRAEATVFFLRMLFGSDFIPLLENTDRVFVYDDVPVDEEGLWYPKWVYAAYDAGLVDGCEDENNQGDLLFRPEDEITRAEAACMMARAVQLR
jgi:hypothetical protein